MRADRRPTIFVPLTAWWHTTLLWQPASPSLHHPERCSPYPWRRTPGVAMCPPESCQMSTLYCTCVPSPLTGGIHRPVVHGPVPSPTWPQDLNVGRRYGDHVSNRTTPGILEKPDTMLIECVLRRTARKPQPPDSADRWRNSERLRARGTRTRTTACRYKPMARCPQLKDVASRDGTHGMPDPLTPLPIRPTRIADSAITSKPALVGQRCRR
jgi:hypothetical protein